MLRQGSEMGNDKWPCAVPWPPPLEINISLVPSELVERPAVEVCVESLLPTLAEKNILSPFRLSKIEYLLDTPRWAWYGHVRIPIAHEDDYFGDR